MAVKIPKQMWRVVTARDHDSGEEGFRLAYLTHADDDKGQEKRQTTGRTWAARYDSQQRDALDEKTFANEPVDGFRIVDANKKTYWGGGNVTWRVEDPRGFTVEIQSGNLMCILASASIDKCVVSSPCVWGIESGRIVLLPTCTPEYEEAAKFTEITAAPATKVSSRDVKVGDLVTLKNGKQGIYLGGHYPLYSQFGENSIEFFFGKKKQFVGTTDELIVCSKLEVLKRSEGLPAQGSETVNEYLSTGSVRTPSGGYVTKPLFVSDKEMPITIDDAPRPEFSDYLYQGNYDCRGRGRTLLKRDGRKYFVSSVDKHTKCVFVVGVELWGNKMLLESHQKQHWYGTMIENVIRKIDFDELESYEVCGLEFWSDGRKVGEW